MKSTSETQDLNHAANVSHGLQIVVSKLGILIETNHFPLLIALFFLSLRVRVMMAFIVSIDKKLIISFIVFCVMTWCEGYSIFTHVHTRSKWSNFESNLVSGLFK